MTTLQKQNPPSTTYLMLGSAIDLVLNLSSLNPRYGQTRPHGTKEMYL